MNITFDEKAKEGLLELLNNSSEEYIRIKTFRGCGRPAYDLIASFKGEDDEEIVINDIKFVYNKNDEKMINGITIKYDKEIYNNGFYIK